MWPNYIFLKIYHLSEALSEAAYMCIGMIFRKQTNTDLSGLENTFWKN